MSATSALSEQSGHQLKVVVTPPEQNAELISLYRFLAHEHGRAHLQLVASDGKFVPIPESVLNILTQATKLMASGDAVSVVSMEQELSLEEAANLLNVSEPYLLHLLEEQQIPFIQTETDCRIRSDELLRYKNLRDYERRALIDELAELSQQYGGYEELQPV